MKRTSLFALVAAIACVAPVPAAAQTTVKLGYATTPTSHYGVGSNAFCEELEKRTSGRYKCQQFPGSALGGEREMIEAVQLGTLDIVNTSTGPVGNFVPEVNIVDIPFLFRDYDHARRVMDGPIGDDLRAKFPAKGLIALGVDRERLPPHDQQQAADRQARGCKGPENSQHAEQGSYAGVSIDRHSADADGVSGAIRGIADRRRRRTGKSDPGDSVRQVFTGAEASVADRARVFASAADRLACTVEQALGRRQESIHRSRQEPLPPRSARRSTTTSATALHSCALAAWKSSRPSTTRRFATR